MHHLQLWAHCRRRHNVHFLREALGKAREKQQPMLAALIWPIFNADSGEQARELVGEAIACLQRPLPKVAALLERAEDDLLAFYAFAVEHWCKLRSTNPLERLNREIGQAHRRRRHLPDDRSLIRLATSRAIEQDDWLVGRRAFAPSEIPSRPAAARAAATSPLTCSAPMIDR